jgi:polysaccharide export outer membrane protein
MSSPTVTALALCGFVVALAVAPCRAAQPPATSAEYIIGPEDVLDIAVWGNTEISRTVPVRADGKISLPLLNDVPVAGLTPMQLRDVLTKLLAKYMASTAVAVIVREAHSFKVTVIGEVRTPGRYEVKSRSTVLDLLAMAGGLTEYADRGSISVLRQEETDTRRIPFFYDKVASKNGSKRAGHENFPVQPGDIIFVP